MVEAPTESQGLVNSVSYFIWLLILAAIVLNLINPSPYYVKYWYLLEFREDILDEATVNICLFSYHEIL